MSNVSTSTLGNQGLGNISALANPAARALVAQSRRAYQLDADTRPWTRVQDALPERMSDGLQISREVQVRDGGCGLPRISRLHYYDNHPSVWDDGDPTHWRDLPGQPI